MFRDGTGGRPAGPIGSIESIADTFRGICAIEASGVRVRTGATIGGARVPIQIDIGFGDAITPGAVGLEYPTMLAGPAPRLQRSSRRW